MNSKPSETMSQRAVLLTSDLIFSTKVTGTARALGLEIAVAADVERAAELCRGEPPGCVFIDLGIPDQEIASVVSRLRIAAGPVPTVAYGSHVDKARLDQARAAGCDEVLPRSKFSAELPDLLHRYLGAQSTLDNAIARIEMTTLKSSMLHEPGNRKYSRSVVVDGDLVQTQSIQSEIVVLAQSCEISEPDLFGIRLALEEALVNAIKHGNGGDPSKKVRIDYEISPEGVCIRVGDEGPGFDPGSVPDPTKPEHLDSPGGRGILLMRHFMSRVRFLGRGNCVELVKLVQSNNRNHP